MQVTVELVVSVLKVDSALLFIVVVKCVSRKESLAAVDVFLLLPTWSEMCGESSLVVLPRRCIPGTERGVKATAVTVCSDSHPCFPAAGGLQLFVVVRVVSPDIQHTRHNRRKALGVLLAQEFGFHRIP